MSSETTSVLTTATAAATIASVALWQRSRTAKYKKAQAERAAVDGIVSAANNGHAHTNGMTPVALADAAEGYELFPIDYTMHAQQRQRLMPSILAADKSAGKTRSAVLLHGGDEVDHYDTDTQYMFRQESFFQYLFGVREPGCAGAIDLESMKSILFVPRLSDEWELWCGERKALSYFKAQYKVDFVFFIDEMHHVLKSEFAVEKLYLLHGKNTDSGLTTATTSTFDGIEDFERDFMTLHPILCEQRLIKTEKELELMRFVNSLSSQAHVQVMLRMKPGRMEFHAESEFLHQCYSKGGARLYAYTCICGSGHNASTLHYGHPGAPNDRRLEDGDLLLNDMGAALHGYASDITCTFPVNGKFTADQRLIYNGVKKSHDAVMDAIRPGVTWVDMHLLSHRVLTQYLLEVGLFQNGTVDELMDHEISAYFFPTGMGHLMGLDVHDVGGFPVGYERSTSKILGRLRCVRTLEKNMVLTIEPGCYFIEAQIKDVLSKPETAKFVNQEMLQRFRGFGGVRIETDVIVTADGVENMTNVPRTVEDIEAVMQGKKAWPAK